MLNNKLCFVIAPIGESDTDIRKHSDSLLKDIVKPSVEPLGYRVIRGDEIAQSGTITNQIIEHTVSADLVIADLSFENPNVYYELAIRHIVRKPVILLAKEKTKIGFDIRGERVIPFEFNDIGKVLIAIVAQVNSFNFDSIQNPFINSWNIILSLFNEHIKNEKNIIARQHVVPFPTHPAEPEMIEVEGNNFYMGCPLEYQIDSNQNESPLHLVTVNDFKISKYPITQGQWKLIMGKNVEELRNEISPSLILDGMGDNYPMYYVSYIDTQEFIHKLNQLTSKHYRLPTEAEWEFAARGGNKSRNYKYSGSNDVSDVAWFSLNSNRSTHPVGTKKPNELGLFDMSGNLYEWCQDFLGDYSMHQRENPIGPPNGHYKVTRGGGWASKEHSCRIYNRGFWNLNDRHISIGFRLVLAEVK